MPIEYLMWSPLVAISLALYVTLAAGAFFSLANSGWVPLTHRRVWTAVVILLPVAGAVLWLAASHRHNGAFPDNVAFPDDVAFPNVASPDDTASPDIALSDDGVFPDDTVPDETHLPERLALSDDRTGPIETVT